MLTKQRSGSEYNQHAAIGTSLQKCLLQLKGRVDPRPTETKHGGVIAFLQIPLCGCYGDETAVRVEWISEDTGINTAS